MESGAAVAECIKAGMRPVMITGDHKITAAAIAREIGILTEGKIAVEGAEIDALTDEELGKFVEKVSVYARVSPEHKIRIVRAWQENGNIVSMTGDGVNDAPALKQADVGVAMGMVGSEVAKDAASMILTRDLLIKILVEGCFIGAFTMTAYHFGLRESEAAASTMAFATLCLSRLVHGFNCKSRRPVIFITEVWNNRYLLGAFGVGIFLLHIVLWNTGLQRIFSVDVLSIKQLVMVYVLSFLNFPIIQMLKRVRINGRLEG